ncbi:MAG: tol-pal system protein YbgF [Methylococcales bacterium]|nr:MAG: tol-pal system protein YbgF [Methylococcales bacterium]
MKKTSLIFLPFIFSSAYADVPVVIDHSLYPQSATPNNPANTQSTTTLYELMGRLEQMQSEVQQLTGKIDEQANRIDDLKKHQGTMYSDFDERLQNIENKANGVTANPNEVAKPSSITTNAKEVQPTTAAPVVVPTNSAQKANPIEKATANQGLKSQIDSPQSQGPDKQGYFMAYDELRSGHTAQSIEQFKAYLNQYPTGEYANNAQYWLGEAYRVNQDNASARKAFNDVLEKYPNSLKVPDAILKLGYIEVDQKNSVKATEYLNRVISDYPKSPAAILASKKLLKLNEAAPHEVAHH